MEIEMKIFPPLGATAEPSRPDAENVPELKGWMIAGGSLPSTIFPSVIRKPLKFPSIFSFGNFYFPMKFEKLAHIDL